MPTYRSITTSIISQHGIFSLPEYPPPTVSNDPFSSLPTLCDQERALVSVYIPTYPSSQFWIRYSIAPPYPPKALYYFKLLLKGTCIVSWGCGEEDGYEGKTMFGLYDSGDCWMGESGVERRILCFGRGAKPGENPAVDSSDVMEIKIYRAKGRMRIKPQIDEFRALVGGSDNVKGPKPNNIGSIRQAFSPTRRRIYVDGVSSLVSAGFLTRKDPQRYYKYALLDPLDKPFATFHYHNRTWRQLAALGVIPIVKDANPVLKSDEPTERLSSPVGSSKTVSSNQTLSSSSSSSNTREHTIISQPTKASVAPPKWAIFAPKLTRSTFAENSLEENSMKEQPVSQKLTARKAVTAPSLFSVSPPHTVTGTQARFTSLVRRARTPSPPKGITGCRMPTPSPQKQALGRGTPTPRLPKRTATRIPTPSPTKSDRIIGRSLMPPIEDMPEIATNSPKSKVPRSGSMNLLLNAVNSAMNRRRRLMIDGSAENSEPSFTNLSRELIPMQGDAPEEVGDSGPMNNPEDTSGNLENADLEKIELLKAPEEVQPGLTKAISSKGSSQAIKLSDDSANDSCARKGGDLGTRSVSDTYSTRRRRWAILGGLKQDKSEGEKVTSQKQSDNDARQNPSKRQRAGRVEKELREQMYA